MAKRANTKSTKKTKKTYKLTAENADKHALYQQSVQNAEHEVELATEIFQRRAGRTPLTLREDFCGTGLLCAQWVQSHAERTATGVDLDASVLAWGRERNIDPLGRDAGRVTLLEQDVRAEDARRHDVLMALNYSYFCFKDRDSLRSYFERAREHLVDDGVFILDLFGGWEAQQVLEEKRRFKHFSYTWHQAEYNPVTADFTAHIHFRFRDKSELREAFTYVWRLWTLPEITELLREAGFAHVEALWEGEDEEGEGNGEFLPVTKADNDPGWNAYLAASVAAPIERTKKKKKSKKKGESA